MRTKMLGAALIVATWMLADCASSVAGHGHFHVDWAGIGRRCTSCALPEPETFAGYYPTCWRRWPAPWGCPVQAPVPVREDRPEQAPPAEAPPEQAPPQQAPEPVLPLPAEPAAATHGGSAFPVAPAWHQSSPSRHTVRVRGANR